MEHKQSIAIGHEVEDASVRGVVYSGIGLAIALAVTALIVLGIFRYFVAHAPQAGVVSEMALPNRQDFPPAPRIEEYPDREVRELRQYEDRLLSTYGWTDENAGLVRIPIERAMQLQIERGFPTRQEAQK